MSLIAVAGCTPAPIPAADPDLTAEIQRIRAIDDHAHPVRVTQPGEPADRLFDALPVDNMEPQSDPVNLRPNAPSIADAWRALYSAGGVDQQRKQTVMQQKGSAYPEWVLDQMGVEVMLANRVSMGPTVQPPRFRWVPYADALIFPLDNSKLAAVNSDRKSFFALEDNLRARYLQDAGLTAPPATLAEYLSRVVTPTLEKQRRGGAVAEKFEAAYLRSLAFDKVDRATAERLYASHSTTRHSTPTQSTLTQATLTQADYKPLQDFLFRYIASECGRLGMAVHIHTEAGAGSYFDVAGANPLNLESVLDDPDLRKTRFVMLHGGWPFIGEITALLTKPNAYLDFSAQDLARTPHALAHTLREWLEFVPEKILFATDAYPYIPEMGWEESGWIAARTGRQALAIALTGMMRDGEITRARASELARMVLRDNARALYGFQ
jgi:predicted TIM-barrel fold metal-dependent hydrolase